MNNTAKPVEPKAGVNDEKRMNQKTKILFVDDEKALRASFRRETRKEKDFVVETASDGVEALEKLESFPADIVVTDLMMPNMNGLELLEHIKSRYPDIFVLFITGSGNVGSAIQAMKSGAYDYIQKPFDSDIFKMAIKKIIKHQRMQREFNAAREKANLLVHLVENASHVMIFIADCQGRIIQSNALARSTFGYPENEMLKRNISDLFELNKKQGLKQLLENVREHIDWRGELSAITKDGIRFPADMAISRSEGNETKNISIICFVRDISREKELDRLKSEFISMASHEIRTPLTSIKNAVDLILKERTGAINEKQEKFLSMAKRNIDRLSGLINNFLDISKMESGKIAFHFETMDIRDCIENAINTVKPLAAEKKIRLDTHVDQQIPGIQADANRIDEVMINLVGNAIKYTRPNGVVAIYAHEITNEPVSDGGAAGFVKVSVTDNGIGIPQERIDHVFDKFYQVESSLSTGERKGVGLGLAICKCTVEGHGGKIACKSKHGQGSTFSFILPIKQQVPGANMIDA